MRRRGLCATMERLDHGGQIFSISVARARCRLKAEAAGRSSADIALYAIGIPFRTSVLALSAEYEICG